MDAESIEKCARNSFILRPSRRCSSCESCPIAQATRDSSRNRKEPRCGFSRLCRSAGLSRSARLASARLCVLLITAERPCLSDIPFDARNWKSFDGRFYSTNARKFRHPRAFHLLKSDPPPSPALFARDTHAGCRNDRCRNGDEYGPNPFAKSSAWKRIPDPPVGPEVGPAASGVSGPRDKELNFPLALYLRGRRRERRRKRLKLITRNVPRWTAAMNSRIYLAWRFIT